MSSPWLPLKRVLVRSPDVEVRSETEVKRWGYQRARNLTLARSQHAHFVAHLRAEGAVVEEHRAALEGRADACYVCDPALMTPRGAIILRMGKELRSGECAAMQATLSALKISIHGTIAAPGTVEGGDCLWLDESTLAVGEGYRTNPEGIRQLKALLPETDVVTIQLVHRNGPDECLHLQSLLSFVDRDAAVIHMALAPVRLIKALRARRVTLIPVTEKAFDRLGTNILCTGPRRVVLAAGNPSVVAALRHHGVHVTEIDAQDLMWVGTGGPTCLTLPLDREGWVIPGSDGAGKGSG